MRTPSVPRRLAVAGLLVTGLLGWSAAAPATAPARNEPAERSVPPEPSRTAGSPSPTPAPRESYAIGAAGDIVCAGAPEPGGHPDRCRYDDTADLLAGLTGVLVLGDAQYETGDYEAFREYYGPTWGRYLARTFPAPGNHEYAEDPGSTPDGYFRYFGDRVKGPDGLGYYSFDLPTGCAPDDDVCWHFIALSSELCFAGDGCDPATDPGDRGPGTQMYEWLRHDLRTHPGDDYPCTLAFWHHPLFSISDGSGATASTRPLWELLHAAGADIVLNGHSHNYQRWLPQDPAGALDPARGIREFVVGTGGASKYPLLFAAAPNLAAAQADAFGILRITLHRASYSWRWVAAAGQPGGFTDASTADVPCV